jgi:hypothetical protein
MEDFAHSLKSLSGKICLLNGLYRAARVSERFCDIVAQTIVFRRLRSALFPYQVGVTPLVFRTNELN